MKAILLPLSFDNQPDAGFHAQLEILRSLLADQAEFLAPAVMGAPASSPAPDAVLFPQMLGDAYRCLAEFKTIEVPILVVTSEFGTVSMWDWEINRFLHQEGVDVIAPYNLEQTRMVCRTLALKRELRDSRFLVYQDNPGEGFQASIFKRFYWWEDDCTRSILEKFGVEIVKKSFRDLGAAAKAIPDAEAEVAWKLHRNNVPVSGISREALLGALKLYLAVKRDILAESGASGEAHPILAAGINCLNESHFSNTTPCLAWNLLYEEGGLLWGCEADTLSMLSKTLVHRITGAPVMMTNLYPFLMGMAALKHERIPQFPAVPDHPEDHILAAHCGYLGVLPRSFASSWTLRRKVLAIVDENATAIDARLPEGAVTLIKLEPNLGSFNIIEGELTGYAQFPGSDCLNGAVLRVPDGRRMMSDLPSHHTILAAGHLRADLEFVAPIFGLNTGS